MRKAILAALGLAALLGGTSLFSGYFAGAAVARGGRAGQTPTEAPHPQPPPPTTFCPPATPEPFWVEPVDSPTCCLAQVISVTIGNGEYVSVSAESGTFAVSGTFSFDEPVTVSISLLPGTTHHLQVAARVRESSRGGCSYGGYTLHTDRDRLGQPLVIVQGDGCHSVYVPLIVKDVLP